MRLLSWERRPGDAWKIEVLGVRVDRILGRRDPSPYMTRVTVGSLRIHWFHRGDEDPDPHDHPFDFWTMPLFRGYSEEVWPTSELDSDELLVKDIRMTRFVEPWRWHRRTADHVHRVVTDRPVLTIVWTEFTRDKNDWGFYVKDGSGRRRRKHWRTYLDEATDS
jgi:hypothetical protein